MMKTIPPILRLVAIVVGYHLLVFGLFALTENKALFSLLSNVMLCVGVAVATAYTPVTWGILLHGVQEKADYLAVGIWLSWIGVILQRGYVIAWESYGRPAWILQNDFRSYFLITGIVAGCLHLVAPRAIGRRIPPVEWIKVGVVLAVGTGVSLLLNWIF